MSRDAREITLIVDGREIAATEGAMLVDAAKHGDVEIPVFCYEPKLGQPVGACRMCLVEIEGMPKLQTACSTPVRDGMVVYTQTDQVRSSQQSVVEFLLVNHPLDCPVCDKGGECPLQDISMGWGPGRSRFTEPKRHFQKPLPLSPLVAIDRERCILCYRCVRFSQEVAEDEQLQLLERGNETFVGTFDNRPYVAPFHGNITELCPVGALTNYTYRFRARPWDIEQAGSICTLCPSQCNVSFTVRDEQVKRVLARNEEYGNPDVDDGWLCDKGRYSFEMLSGEARISRPMVRAGGNARPASWEDALELTARGLRAAGTKTAAIVGDASNEEGYLVQRIVREALGSADIESRLAPGAGRDSLLRLSDPSLGTATREIDSAEAILVLGTDPLHAAPILDLRIRKAVRRSGAKLCVATERPTALDGGATAVARYSPGGATAFLDALAGGSGDAAEIAAVLRGASRVVIVWGERIGREGPGAVAALLELAGELKLAETDGAGLLEVPDSTNARGLREVGCVHDAGPGLIETAAGADADAIRKGLEDGEIEAVILFGADPLRDAPDSAAWERALGNADFVLAFSLLGSKTTGHADVVFPLESHAEKEGTVTHPDGRLQRVRPSVKRPGDVRPAWQVLAELSAALGHETGIESEPDALAAIAEAVPFYAGITADEIGGRGIRWQERDAGQGRGDALADDTQRRPAAAAPRQTTPPFSAGAEAEGAPPPPTPGGDGLLLGTYRDIWAGPVTEFNPPLHFLEPKQTVEIAPEDAERIGVSDEDEVRVRSNGTSVAARVQIRERMRPGAVFLIEGTAQDNANVLLNGTPLAVEIEKAAAE